MAWVFLATAAGTAAFLVVILLEYLKTAATLKPKADVAKKEIQEYEARIQGEQSNTASAQGSIESLQKEIDALEKEIKELEKVAEENRERERRRKPTKFKLEE